MDVGLVREWAAIGVETHVGKHINAAALGQAQGAEAGNEAPSIGLGGTKVVIYMRSALDLIIFWHPHRRSLWRRVGKGSHLCEFCPPLRPTAFAGGLLVSQWFLK